MLKIKRLLHRNLILGVGIIRYSRPYINRRQKESADHIIHMKFESATVLCSVWWWVPQAMLLVNMIQKFMQMLKHNLIHWRSTNKQYYCVISKFRLISANWWFLSGLVSCAPYPHMGHAAIVCRKTIADVMMNANWKAIMEYVFVWIFGKVQIMFLNLFNVPNPRAFQFEVYISTVVDYQARHKLKNLLVSICKNHSVGILKSWIYQKDSLTSISWFMYGWRISIHLPHQLLKCRFTCQYKMRWCSEKLKTKVIGNCVWIKYVKSRIIKRPWWWCYRYDSYRKT